MTLPFRRAVAGAALSGLVASLAAGDVGRWTTSGPADVPFVQSIAPHPTVPLRAACYRSVRGVLVTEDGGLTWTPRNHGLHGFDWFGLVAWDSALPARLYAVDDTFHRSDDGGRSWIGLASGIRWSSAAELLVDALTPGRLLVAKWDGVWESRDSGQTWGVLSAGWPGGDVSGLAFSRSDPSVLFASFRAPRGQGVWRFHALTRRWTAANSGIGAECWVWDVAVAPSDAARSFATATCSGTGSVVFRTSDGGATWDFRSRNRPASPWCFPDRRRRRWHFDSRRADPRRGVPLG